MRKKRIDKLVIVVLYIIVVLAVLVPMKAMDTTVASFTVPSSPYTSPNYIVTFGSTRYVASLTQGPSDSTALTRTGSSTSSYVYTITLYVGETLRLVNGTGRNSTRWNTTNNSSSSYAASTSTSFNITASNVGTTTYYLYTASWVSYSRYGTINVVVKDFTNETATVTVAQDRYMQGDVMTVTANYTGSIENVAYLWWTSANWDGGGSYNAPIACTTEPVLNYTIPSDYPIGTFDINVDVVAYNLVAGMTLPNNSYGSLVHLAYTPSDQYTIQADGLGTIALTGDSSMVVLGSTVSFYATHTRQTTESCYYFWWSAVNNWSAPIGVTEGVEYDVFLDPTLYNSSNLVFAVDAVLQSDMPAGTTDQELMTYYAQHYADTPKVLSNRYTISYAMPYPEGVASMNNPDGSPKAPTIIEGVDTTGAINLHVFDYWAKNDYQHGAQVSDSYNQGINSYYSNSNFAFFNNNGVPNANKSSSRGNNGKNGYDQAGVFTGIMENYLTVNNNGVRLPVFNNAVTDGAGSVANTSTGYLFDYSQEYQYMSSYSANKLFLYDENTGEYYYRSAVNAAPFNTQTGEFTLYDNAVVVPFNGTEGSITGGTSFVQGDGKVAGNFFPFNDYVGGVQDIRSHTDSRGTVNNIDAYSADLSINYWFGLSMETAFYINDDITAIDGSDLVFEFTGDDDVWIYLDNVLAIDLGGVHDACSCTVNYTTGVINIVENIDNYYGRYRTSQYTLYSVMQTAYTSMYNDLGATEFYAQTGFQTVASLMNDRFVATGETLPGTSTPLYTFKPGSVHRLNFYYMERGGNLSDLTLMFNMSPVENGFYIEKEINDFGDFYKDDMGFNFKIFYSYDAGLISGYGSSGNFVEGVLVGGESIYSQHYIYDRATNTQIGGIHDIDAEGNISLEAGQYAVFPNLPPYWRCMVAEISVYYLETPNDIIPLEDSDFVPMVIENGTPRDGYQTNWFDMADAVSVKIINTIGKPCSLTVTKVIDLADLENEFGSNIFFFELEDAEGRLYTEVIEFGSDNYEICPDDPTKIQISKTFINLPYGEYTLSELATNRFRLVDKWGEGNSFIDDDAPGAFLHFSLTREYETGEGFYYNDLFHQFYYSDAAFRDNEMTIVEP